MKTMSGIFFVLFVSAYLSAPRAAETPVLGGDCHGGENGATNISNEYCDPDAATNQVCYGITYEACHTTPGLTIDLKCVDNQLNNPCHECGGPKDADYEDCESS